MDIFLIAQVIGAFALTSSIIGVCQKSRIRYIVFNIIQNIFSGVQYLLLGKNIAFYLCIFGIFRLIIYSFKNNLNKILDVIILIVVLAINTAISLVGYVNYFDLIPLIASSLVCFTVWQNNLTIIRLGVIISKAMWGIYAVISRAYFSVIMDVFLIIWSIIIITCDYRKQTKNCNKD